MFPWNLMMAHFQIFIAAFFSAHTCIVGKVECAFPPPLHAGAPFSAYCLNRSVATCHKYGHTLTCRFHYPWSLRDEVTKVLIFDAKRSTGRVQLCTPRNNSFLNRHCGSPHVVACWMGNTDATVIDDQVHRLCFFLISRNNIG